MGGRVSQRADFTEMVGRFLAPSADRRPRQRQYPRQSSPHRCLIDATKPEGARCGFIARNTKLLVRVASSGDDVGHGEYSVSDGSS